MDRLNRLFSQAASPDEADDLDFAEPLEPPQGGASAERGAGSSSSSSSGGGDGSKPTGKSKSRLRQYIESFDQQTLVDTARVVSIFFLLWWRGCYLDSRAEHVP